MVRLQIQHTRALPIVQRVGKRFLLLLLLLLLLKQLLLMMVMVVVQIVPHVQINIAVHHHIGMIRDRHVLARRPILGNDFHVVILVVVRTGRVDRARPRELFRTGPDDATAGNDRAAAAVRIVNVVQEVILPIVHCGRGRPGGRCPTPDARSTDNAPIDRSVDGGTG